MRRSRRWVVAGGLAVGVLVAAVIAETRGPTYPGAPPGAPGSVAQHGRRYRYVALLHWADATALDDRHIRIQVSHAFPSSANACAADATRVLVHEGAAQITISVAGYGTKHRHPVACPVDQIVDRQVVSLIAPLGARHLVDGSDGAVRAVLPVSPSPAR